MRPRISIRGSVLPYVRPSVCPLTLRKNRCGTHLIARPSLFSFSQLSTGAIWYGLDFMWIFLFFFLSFHFHPAFYFVAQSLINSSFFGYQTFLIEKREKVKKRFHVEMLAKALSKIRWASFYQIQYISPTGLSQHWDTESGKSIQSYRIDSLERGKNDNNGSGMFPSLTILNHGRTKQGVTKMFWYDTNKWTIQCDIIEDFQHWIKGCRN